MSDRTLENEMMQGVECGGYFPRRSTKRKNAVFIKEEDKLQIISAISQWETLEFTSSASLSEFSEEDFTSSKAI